MAYKTILLSPHSDDIAYSIGGLLALNYFQKPTEIVIVFSKSNFSPCIKLVDFEVVSKTRYSEDYAFADLFGLDIQNIPFQDAMLRGYSNPQLNVFNNLNIASEPIFDKLYNELNDIIMSQSKALIVSPMGIGGHIDHLLVSEICSMISKNKNINIIFYEDLPYVASLTLKQIKERANLLNQNLRPYKVDITSVFYKKIKYLKLYKSQVCEKMPMRVLLHASRLGYDNERLIDFIWQHRLFKYLFREYYITSVNIPLFERLWL